MSKEIPMELENIITYSDIGKGGRCPICRAQNRVVNSKYTECDQRLKGGVVSDG